MFCFLLTCSRGVGSGFQDALIIDVITNCYECGTLQMMVSGYPDTRRMKLFWQLVSGKGLVGLRTAFLYDVSSAFCQDKRPR